MRDTSTCSVVDVHKNCIILSALPYPTVKLYIVLLGNPDHKEQKAKWVLQEDKAPKEKKASIPTSRIFRKKWHVEVWEALYDMYSVAFHLGFLLPLVTL